jgi:hypothetical protein
MPAESRLLAVKAMSCVRCGSMRMRPARGALHQRVLAFVLRQDVVACSRCGLPARHSRAGSSAAGPKTTVAQRDAAGPALDLETLDRALESGSNRPSGRSDQ